MSKFCKGIRARRFRLGFFVGISALLLGASGVRAASLELIVTESGGPPIIISDGSVFDTNPLAGAITVDVTLLNGLLTNYQFNDLGALSNSPGGNTASLSQTGTVQLITGGSGSISIVATDVDFNLPSGPLAVLQGSGQGLFTATTAGNNQTFQSWYNPSNSLAGKENPATLLTFTSTGPIPNQHGGDQPIAISPGVTPFGLTNENVITLTGGTSTNPAKDQFGGSTVLTAVPEPASVALMGIALPLALVGLRAWRRRSV